MVQRWRTPPHPTCAWWCLSSELLQSLNWIPTAQSSTVISLLNPLHPYAFPHIQGWTCWASLIHSWKQTAMGAENPHWERTLFYLFIPALWGGDAGCRESWMWAPKGTSECIQVQFHNLQGKSCFQGLRTIQNHMTCYWQPRPQALPTHLREGRGEEESSHLEESTVNRVCLVILLDRNKLFQGNPAPRRLRNEWKGGNLKMSKKRAGSVTVSHPICILWTPRCYEGHFMLDLP